MRGGRGGRAGEPAFPSAALLDWFDAHRRPLPWRTDLDPYRRWVAEVFLQQTRVGQAEPYFVRFLTRFPTVQALAAASRPEVLRAWQGAGYYARARHLHDGARQIVRARHGLFPRSRAQWATVPGVGPYIAAALASLLADEPVVALDANVVRVAARWFRERGDVRRSAVRARLESRLARLLPADRPGAFNEAVMELGETICRPVAPSCPQCPVRSACRAARELADPGALPRRPRRAAKPHVRAAVVVLERAGRWWMQRRPDVGFLGGLWEFPGGKIEAGERPGAAARRELREESGMRAGPLRYEGVVRHAYSHFSVDLHVFRGAALGGHAPSSPGRWIRPSTRLPVPIARGTEKIVRRLLTEGRASPDSGSRPGRRLGARPAAAGSRPVRSRGRGGTA